MRLGRDVGRHAEHLEYHASLPVAVAFPEFDRDGNTYHLASDGGADTSAVKFGLTRYMVGMRGTIAGRATRNGLVSPRTTATCGIRISTQPCRRTRE